MPHTPHLDNILTRFGATALLQSETKTFEESSAETELSISSVSLEDISEVTTYIYYANGNQITKTADNKTETNMYDGLNQLIGYTDGETEASYSYNVDGLRIQKIVDGETIHQFTSYTMPPNDSSSA
ncbi:MAG: hypothetical protein LUG26_04830 [Ruminococcus sp.]|nr:hypothetical protein [Ruminococcus sp.]